MMEPAPEGGYVVASPPRGAGRRGRPSSKLTAIDWAKVDEWHQAHPGVWARYGPVPSNQLTEVKPLYPELTFLGFHHHHVLDTSAQHELRKVCEVFVCHKPEEET
jgi:hypothetical protein